MKNKGNTHQNSCIVQSPTFLCLLCLELRVWILLFSSYSSLWLLPKGSCTLTGCHHVIITWYNKLYDVGCLIYLFPKIICYIVHLESSGIHMEEGSVLCKSQECHYVLSVDIITAVNCAKNSCFSRNSCSLWTKDGWTVNTNINWTLNIHSNHRRTH